MFRTPEPDPGLDSVIADCESELRSLSADSKEYKEALARYKDLKALKASQRPSVLSPDTVLLAATNILGILLVIRHENVNVITTKAFGLVKKII